MSFITGGSPSLPPIQQAPQREDPAVQEARRKALIAARLQKGRASTLLTGGQGVPGQPNLQRKSLLGQ